MARNRSTCLIVFLALFVIPTILIAESAVAQVISIPAVVGMTETEARSTLEAAGVTGTISARAADDSECAQRGSERGRICGQSPPAGAKQASILDVWLFFEAEKEVPVLRLPERVLRNTPEWGRAKLAEVGFTGPVAIVSSSQAGVECARGVPNAELGQVCNLLPADQREAKADTKITLVVQGPRTAEDPYEYLPDLRGVPLEPALNRLRDAGFLELQFRIREPGDCVGVDPGAVCAVNGGEVGRLALRKTRVRLDVATRYPLVERPESPRTPDLSKAPLSVAREKLDAIGFRSPILISRDRSCQIEEETGLAAGMVCGQSSAPGSLLPLRSPISLTVYERRDRGGFDIGKPWIRMPDLRGKSREEAGETLRELGFERVSFEERDEMGCPPSTVCASDPPSGKRAFLSMDQIVYVGLTPPPAENEPGYESGGPAQEDPDPGSDKTTRAWPEPSGGTGTDAVADDDDFFK